MKKIVVLPARITHFLSRNRGRYAKMILMVLVFITALYTKEYRGEYQLIINNQIGGVFYVLFGALLFSVLFPRIKAYISVLIALGLTSMLELIQWFRFPFMVELTKNKVMAYLFGVSFNPCDFLYYAAGAVLALAALLVIETQE